MNAILSSVNVTTRLTTRVLIVDDDEGIRNLVSTFLAKHGFEVDTASDPTEMRRHLGRVRYDLIVLDVMMPGEDGLTALRKLLRDGGPPVIMLSAVGTDIDRIVGLEIGAEDYLAKPCNPRELLARIRTVLRRNTTEGRAAGPDRPARESGRGSDQGERLEFAGWRIDLVGRALNDPAGRAVLLTDGEFRLLRAFTEHPRRVLTRDQLMSYARGPEAETFDRAIDVQISRLRRKLTSSGEAPVELIRTVRNEGYMFVPTVARV